MVRIPVPTAADISAAQQKFKQIYQSELDDVQGTKEKAKLAEEMLEDSRELEGDPPGRYVTQAIAMTLASEAGEPETLVAGIDERVVHFEVDPYEENLKWLNFFSDRCQLEKDDVDGGPFVERAIRVLYAGYVVDDYDRMADLARHCFKYATDSPDSEATKLANKIRVAMLRAGREYRRAREALDTYRENPDDKDAARVVGMFLCFYKGDWDRGLPILAEAAKPPLGPIARRDVEGAESNEDRIALGDAWWDLGEQARTDFFREACQSRAVYWYRGTLSTLPQSLDRMHAEGRVEEFDDIEASGPRKVLEKLAEEYKVDLTTNLAAISMGKTASR